MTGSKLTSTLRSMVSEYGFERVNKVLHQVATSTGQSKESKLISQSSNKNKQVPVVATSKKRRATAEQFVERMELSPERYLVIVELAKRFERKSFLPTSGDVRNFCQIYGLDEPASKSRSSAIPRVFRFLATMETDEIKKVLEGGMFSGPSRLGPIADTIRRNGRAFSEPPSSK